MGCRLFHNQLVVIVIYITIVAKQCLRSRRTRLFHRCIVVLNDCYERRAVKFTPFFFFKYIETILPWISGRRWKEIIRASEIAQRQLYPWRRWKREYEQEGIADEAQRQSYPWLRWKRGTRSRRNNRWNRKTSLPVKAMEEREYEQEGIAVDEAQRQILPVNTMERRE